MNLINGTVLTVVTMMVSGIAQAHHSYAMFDTTKQVTIVGTVRTLEWSSPHVWLWVESPDGKGGSETYGFETVSPAQLQRDYGWNKNVVHTGDKITVLFAPLRSGKSGGELEKVTLENGKVLATRFTANGPQPNAAETDTKK